ncbi:DUF4097 and DUF4098 domain-containing protein YvlB [Fontibacillus phaseoli]|uniref:DUF4097 and DUF4098 domain-containing protein YvlB n=1 Tax=Fontibacillus phaseoli TaxID=1416533 RepID=A0A369AXS8_9BACL|nr:DUF4097 family beta strand repeat-containing protein [Fontibacillus phaseoli]RCX13895.1 DUF4097 and DUF4098 domain-containing protein YvlB [Fontibacillus phaseoli]
MLKTPVNLQNRQALQLAARTKGFQPRRRKRKFIACLFSAIFPGLGHLYLKMFFKGAGLIYFILLDSSALIYFSSVRGGINVPLLILLGLLIPSIYFYSIYDVLQSTDVINAKLKRAGMENEGKDPGTNGGASGSSVARSVLAGLLLMCGGAVIFLFRQKPPWLEGFVAWSSGYVVAASLILAGLMFIWRENRRRFLRTGRFTASILIIAVGVLLLIDRITGQDLILLLRKWWPLILVSGGVEHILVLIRNRRHTLRPERRLRVDMKGLLLSVCIGVSVFAVTQQEHYLHLWNRVSLDLAAAGSDFSSEEGFHTEKPSLEIPIDLDTEQIKIDGVNGNIDVRRAEIEGVAIHATVWVDQIPVEAAEEVAEKTTIDTSIGKTLAVTVKDKTYSASGKRHPRVNLTVILPENRYLDIDISTSSGSITLTGAQALKQIKLQTGNGNLRMWDVVGDVSAKTLNGDAELYRVFGDVSIDTQGGNLKGKGISGNASLSTMVGDISLVNAEADIKASTKNGNVKIDGATSALQAESLNGKIQISTREIGGDWSVYSAVGEMQLEIPDTGDYTLEGSSGYGDIRTDLPFIVENKEITGVSGSGEYQIKVDGNSNLIVTKS